MARNLNRYYGSTTDAQACGCVQNAQPVLFASTPSSAWYAKAVPAMAYVPPQKWEDVYDAAAGLQRGTIFEVLDKPFMGRMEVCCR